jgi:hypothetical protein
LKTDAETAAAPMVMAAWANMNASGEVEFDDKNMLYRFSVLTYQL